MAGALIGALRVSLSAETSAFEAGMKRAQKSAATTSSRIKNSFGSIGGELGLLKGAVGGFIAALSVGTILAAGRAALEYAGSLGEVAQSLGVTTKELQTFRFAVEQNGGTAEQADLALGKLAISISKAQSGSKQAAAAFGAVGVKLEDLRNSSRQEVLGKIADKMKETGGAANNAAAGVAIFGKGFLKIAPALDQGSAGLNNLAEAAQKLGIVLSDKQIAQADETADKLDALQTVLKAQIAGVVADNADAILGLANAIAQVAREASQAIGWLKNFYAEAQKFAAKAEIALSNSVERGPLGFLGIGSDTRAKNRAAAQGRINAINKQQADDRFNALFTGRPKLKGGGALPQFLAGGGGSKKHTAKADHSAEKALREQNQFDQDILRAKQDVLSAQQALADNADDRANIELEQLTLDRRIFEGQLAYEVKLNELTKGEEGKTQAQADQLLELYRITESLKREGILQEQAEENLRFVARLKDVNFDLERDRLQSEAQLAETASEQRTVQLRLLDLAYRQERARLNSIMAEEKVGSVAWEEARLRLANLDRTYANDRQGVVNSTRGPMDEYLASLPTTAAKAEEALQRLEVQGFEGLIDAALALSEGFDSAKDALLQTLKDFVLGIARMQLQSALGGLLKGGAGGNPFGFLSGLFGGGGSSASSGFLSSGIENNVLFGGGLPGFASGGAFTVLGRRGIDQNVLSMNGIPIARVSYGERASFSNDNASHHGGMGRALVQNFNFPNSDFDSFRRNESQAARMARRRLQI